MGKAPRHRAAIHEPAKYGLHRRAHGALWSPAGGSRAGHTWEWDSRLWTQRQDMGPPSRVSPGLAHDGERDRVVLLGGVAAAPPSSLIGDTWELAILEH